MREDFVGQFCDLYWDGLSARPEDASNLDECRSIVASLVDTVLAIETERSPVDNGAAVQDERFEAVARRITSLLHEAPDVATVGLLQRAAIDLITTVVHTLAELEGRDPRSVLRAVGDATLDGLAPRTPSLRG